MSFAEAKDFIIAAGVSKHSAANIFFRENFPAW